MKGSHSNDITFYLLAAILYIGYNKITEMDTEEIIAPGKPSQPNRCKTLPPKYFSSFDDEFMLISTYTTPV